MRVALFTTCLVDLFRPTTGFSTIELLEQAGCQVEVPGGQTCCGQPAYNNGDRDDAIRIAKQTITQFENYDYVVIPSGSCGGMIANHYPELLKNDPAWYQRAKELGQRSYELTVFLYDILKITQINHSFPADVTYHSSCSSLRETHSNTAASALLQSIDGLNYKSLTNNEVCCGFGGTFSVKYPAISVKMVDDKINHINNTQAQVLTATDLGCLMHISGRLKRQGSPIKVLHIAEILTGKIELAGIAEQTDKDKLP